SLPQWFFQDPPTGQPRHVPADTVRDVDYSPRLKAGDSCFSGACRGGHGPPRSDRLSTGVHRQPRGQAILRGGAGSGLPDAAVRTGPLARVQGQGVADTPTGRAAFGAGRPLVKGDEGTPVPGRFVLELAPQLAPAHLTDGLGERVGADQVLDRQRLDTDHL